MPFKKYLTYLIGLLLFLPALLCSQVMEESVAKLREAQSIEGDFERVKTLSQEAAAGFEQLGIDSLLLDSKLSWAISCYYTRDRDCFAQQVNESLTLALETQDSAALIKCYNFLGFNEFSSGNSKQGLAYLSIPFFKSYYSENALEESVTNLGSLIDVGLLYTNSLDTVYLYVNKLQELASLYDDPDVQVVSKFKLANLFSKALNFKGAIATLKDAKPYLPYVDNKGFLHFYYRQMISSFIELNEPDSALHYISVLRNDASYSQNDPRNCLIIASEAKARLKLDTNNEYVLPQEFLSCYDQKLSQSNGSGRSSVDLLGMMYTISTYHYKHKDWIALKTTLATLIDKCISSNNSSVLSQAYELQYKLYQETGEIKKSLESLEKHTELEKSNNQYVFSQSEALIRNQLDYQLSQQENLLLLTENQNQQLIIEKDKRERILYGMGIFLLTALVIYYLNAARLGKTRRKELNEIIRDRTSELKSSNEALISSNTKLLETNEELKRFAFLTSHDLKTPLHNILTFTSLLKMRCENFKDDKVSEYLSMIKKGGEQMNALIEDVLEYSQLSQAGMSKSQELSTDLVAVIEEIKESISFYLAERSAEVVVEEEIPQLKIEKTNLFILFKNLIENAIKYNHSDRPTVHIVGLTKGDSYIIEVRDNGIGIEEKYTKDVFDMFSRLHTHHAYDGTGIGLATCKKIVENEGGTISIDSTLGKGTTFIISLPMNQCIVINSSIQSELISDTH